MRKDVRLLILALLALLWLVGAYAQDNYTVADTKTFSIVTKYELENTSQYTLTQVVATVLLGANTDTLYQQKVRFRVNPAFSSKSEDALGNTTGVFNIGALRPGEKRTILVEKIVKNSAISFPKEIFDPYPDYAPFLADPKNAQYVKPSKHIESDAPEIKAEAAKVPTDRPAAERVWDAYYLVNNFMQYDTSDAYSHQGALNALKTHRGVCTEFSALLVALCRSMGIPARVVAGYWEHKSLVENQTVNVEPDRHAWAEFYLPGYGWIPAEPTMILALQNGQRLPNYNFFARIPSTDRHFVCSYGLEIERGNDIDVRYAYQAPLGGGGGDMLRTDIASETITMLPDDAPAPAL